MLGSILLNDSLFVQAAGTLEAEDFSLEAAGMALTCGAGRMRLLSNH